MHCTDKPVVRRHTVIGEKWEEGSPKNKFTDPAPGKWKVVGGGTQEMSVSQLKSLRKKEDWKNEVRHQATETW